MLLCFGIKSKGFLTKNDPKVLSPAPEVVDFQFDCGGWSCDCGGLAPALNYVRRVPAELYRWRMTSTARSFSHELIESAEENRSRDPYVCTITITTYALLLGQTLGVGAFADICHRVRRLILILTGPYIDRSVRPRPTGPI